MKSIINILLTVMLVFTFACSSSNYLNDPSYSPPTISFQPRLIYPTLAQENFWQGKTTVYLRINKEGKVTETRVSNSSGYTLLDNTAEDFCKEIVFNPALNNNRPVQTQLRMGVHFSFEDDNFNAKNYIKEINALYSEIYVASDVWKLNYQNQILEKHFEFIKETKDALNFNYYLSFVVEDNIVSDWQDVWNTWPLSFLIYHDFLTRYNTFADSAKVKMSLYSALKEDVKYIEKSSNNIEEKEIIFGKIITFMKNEYPELKIDAINFDLDKTAKPNI